MRATSQIAVPVPINATRVTHHMMRASKTHTMINRRRFAFFVGAASLRAAAAFSLRSASAFRAASLRSASLRSASMASAASAISSAASMHSVWISTAVTSNSPFPAQYVDSTVTRVFGGSRTSLSPGIMEISAIERARPCVSVRTNSVRSPVGPKNVSCVSIELVHDANSGHTSVAPFVHTARISSGMPR